MTDPKPQPPTVEIPENFRAIMEAYPDLSLEDLNSWRERPDHAAELAELEEYRAIGSVSDLQNHRVLMGLGTAYLESVRNETIANYKLSVGPDAIDPVIIQLLETATLEQLQAFNKSYKDLADAKMPLTCEHCGSHQVTRASSVAKAPLVSPDREAVVRRNRNSKPSDIHR